MNGVLSSVGGIMATRIGLDPMLVALGRRLPNPLMAVEDYRAGIINDFFWKFFAGGELPHDSRVRPNAGLLDILQERGVFGRKTVGRLFMSRAAAVLTWEAIAELAREYRQNTTRVVSQQDSFRELFKEGKLSPTFSAMLAEKLAQVPKDLETANAIVRSVGKEEGELGQVDVTGIINLARKLDAEVLRRFLGAARAMLAPRKVRVRESRLTRDILNAFPTERLLLFDEQFGDYKLLQYARHGLLGLEPFAEGGHGGDIFVLIDGSGSMLDDNRLVWAHALFLALLEASRDSRRRCRGAVFGSAGEYLFRDDPLDVLGHSFGSGTSFDYALTEALNHVKPGERIIVLTDGEDSVSGNVKEHFLASGHKLTTILINSDNQSLAQLSSAVISINDISQASIERAAETLRQNLLEED
jgi:hypothetical protein